jgi:hypothetical protein
MDKYNMLYCESPKPGIVLPSDFGSEVRFYQIRVLNPERDKFMSPSKSVKPLYGDVFLTNPNHVNLCEGVMSGISSVSGREDRGVLVTYGKSMTDYQYNVMKSLKPKKITIMYDGGEIRAPIRLAQKMQVDFSDVRMALLPFGKDPGDLTLEDRINVTEISMNPISIRLMLSKLPEDSGKWDMNEKIWKSIGG